jgi:hypothetical protein
MSSLKIELTKNGTDTLITLSGHINEDSDLSLMKEMKGNELTLDLKAVSLINSCGIRDWIEFQKVNFDFSKVTYRNCPQVIIEQMNIVAGFIHPHGEIESFFAPYYSETSDQEVKLLITPSEVLDGKAPSKKNDAGEELEFDDIEAQYFNFLKK